MRKSPAVAIGNPDGMMVFDEIIRYPEKNVVAAL